jgi:predicted O-methyltransferase YrrM
MEAMARMKSRQQQERIKRPHWRPRDSDYVRIPTEAQLADYRTPAAADLAEFNRLTAGLPLGEMYGMGPHSVPILRDILSITRAQRILEFGFGAGGSAALWLGLVPPDSSDREPVEHVVSIDNTTNPKCLAAAKKLVEAGRFTLLNMDSRKVSKEAIGGGDFDLVFIDAGHDLPSVANDLAIALDLNPAWIAFDDWWPMYGPGVQPAIDAEVAKGRLEVVEQWGNVILARPVRS